MSGVSSPPLQLASRRPPIARTTDRRITLAGLLVAGTYLAAAAASLLLPPAVRHGGWLPLHLALAGAATSAIGAALPFFTSALSASPPADARGRVLVLALLGGGAAAITAGVTGGSWLRGDSLAAAGGAAFVAGVVALGWVAFAPLRGGLGTRRPLVLAAYAVALADVGTGATIATLYVGGYGPVAAAWDDLRAVHAWLNLYGFVSLVIGGTLVHLLPTVLGTLIRGDRTVLGVVAGLALGPALVAAGLLVAPSLAGPATAVARLGSLAELAGAAALLVYVGATWRRRGRWTSDAGWHLLTGGSLSAAAGWFAVSVAIGGGRLLVFGAAPGAWSLEAVAAPLVLGWVVQAIVGAWTHLAPAIGPGDPVVHARQRDLLGRAAAVRLACFQLGVAGLAVGVPLGSDPLVIGGGLLAAAVLLVSLALLVRAALLGRSAGSRAEGRVAG